MAGVSKVVIVQKKYVTPTLMQESGLGEYLKGEPLNISPVAWREEAGLSHYGYLLQGMKLKALKLLTEWNEVLGHSTILDVEKDDDTTSIEGFNAILNRVGLRVNELAD